ncbi:DUF1906 domain-containing protein [Rhodococcus sp. SGAir0479]|uniref:DUF1906 domain-containing protein n=1 Tax=Rhodococcus sp. SGAir0479 TaxID=2567884 RepID=UPI0010CCC61E|nr:DUF1906 domain-containing protein [Rhodococcus sp. SGAir0479]QCQ90273.1 DUF1906 domain-containing protein [Rhodococcus sp. SGAir0479]
MQVSRRGLFKIAAAGTAAAGLAAVAGPSTANAGPATLVDFSAGVPSPLSIRAAGHVGAIRYVSDRRPGAEWMLGKPMQVPEATAMAALGLQIVSCYQFGKGETSDWRGGFDAGVRHAQRGRDLHRAAGGPDDAPIYAAIDDNPSAWEFDNLIAPYLRGWANVVGRENVGVYANTPTIDRCLRAGVGTWFWQHNWGTPAGYVHPAAHLHQFEIDKRKIDGIGVDLNSILKPDYGQWALRRPFFLS